jgi:hypothetical protein
LRTACFIISVWWLFAGSNRGGVRTAVTLTRFHTAKLNDIDPRAWRCSRRPVASDDDRGRLRL